MRNEIGLICFDIFGRFVFEDADVESVFGIVAIQAIFLDV